MVEGIARLRRQAADGVGDVVVVGDAERMVVVGPATESAVVTVGAGGEDKRRPDQLTVVWRPSAGRSPAGALLATIAASRAGGLTLPFDVDALTPYVTALAVESTDAMRLLALDAIELGQYPLVEELPLPAGERQLLYAWREIVRGLDGPHTIDRVRAGWDCAPALAAEMLVALWPYVDARRDRLRTFLGPQSGPPMVGAARAIMTGDLDGLGRHLDDLGLNRAPAASDRPAQRVGTLNNVGAGGQTTAPDLERMALNALAGRVDPGLQAAGAQALSALPGPVVEDLTARGALGPSSGADRGPADHDAPGPVDVALLRSARDQVRAWDWAAGLELAGQAEQAATDVTVRTEARNVQALCHWQIGQSADALATLERALREAPSDALLINAATVATEVDPAIATDYLARVAAEGATGARRVRAVERALELWRLRAAGANGDAGAPIPSSLRNSLRALAACDGLVSGQHRRVLELLSTHDAQWLGSAPDAEFGRRADRPETRVARARARGGEEWIVELAESMAGPGADGSGPWLAEQRDRLVHSLIASLAGDVTDSRALPAALAALGAGLAMDADDGVELRALAVSAACATARRGEPEPSEALVRWAEEASDGAARLDRKRRRRIQPVVDAAGDAVAAGIVAARAGRFDEVLGECHDMLVDLRLLPPERIDRRGVQLVLDASDDFCAQTAEQLRRADRLARDRRLRSDIAELNARLDEARQASDEVRAEW